MLRLRKSSLVGLALIGFVTLALPLNAQTDKGDFTIGKKGEVHFNVKVKAGSATLEPGMYQIQHAIEGTEHVLTFKAVEMPAGYRHGNTAVAKDTSARVKCRVEAVDKKVSKTAITLRTNAAGEKEVADVLVAGEAFKHVL